MEAPLQSIMNGKNAADVVSVDYSSFRGRVLLFWAAIVCAILIAYPSMQGMQVTAPFVFCMVATVTHRVCIVQRHVLLQLGPLATCVFSKSIPFEDISAVHLVHRRDSCHWCPVHSWAYGLTRGADIVILKTKTLGPVRVSVPDANDFLMAMDSPGEPKQVPVQWVLCDLLV